MTNESRIPDLPLLSLLFRLLRHAPAARRRQFAVLTVFMVVGSAAEALGIGAVLPFLAALTQPEHFIASSLGRSMASALSIESPRQLLLPVTVLFCLATTVAGATRLALVWSSTRFAFAAGSDLSDKVYGQVLYQSYVQHTRRNSSEVIDAIWGKVSEVLFFVILPSMIFISATFVAVVICGVLYFAVPRPALLAFLALGFVYALFVWLAKRRLASNSRRIAEGSSRLVRTLQEGLGGIRDIIIDHSQPAFIDHHRAVDRQLRRAQAENQILGQVPRFVVEALGMLLVAGLAYALTSGGPAAAASAIPTLAAMALGMQRLLPALQQLYGAWSSLHGTKASLGQVLALLDAPFAADAGKASEASLPFDVSIALRNVGFRYHDDAPWVLRNIDLTVPKGRKIGLVGPTGCGKSTLVDIAMGLLQPTSGTLEIDGRIITAAEARSWQRHIAHVPQSVFLADASIAQNIAFGVPESAVDGQRVREAARLAQLADVIEAMPAGYETRVGERGVQLSGGQRQRIGIARALYKRADVIVFDEATSALDGTTEQAVMQAIEALGRDVTIVMIAHRINTLRGCDEVVELANGTIVARHDDIARLA